VIASPYMEDKSAVRLTVGPISANCWIYPLGKETAAVIDPGDEADKIISALDKLSLYPRYILLTHGHFDHIAAVPRLAKEYAPRGAQIAIHRADAKYLGADAYAVHAASVKAAIGDASLVEAFRGGLPPADIELEEGSIIGTFTVLHLPGHSAGSAAFWDRENGVIFTGDTLFKDGIGRTDLPDGDWSQINASLKRLFGMDAAIKVCPGHGQPTTIGQEAARSLY